MYIEPIGLFNTPELLGRRYDLTINSHNPEDKSPSSNGSRHGMERLLVL